MAGFISFQILKNIKLKLKIEEIPIFLTFSIMGSLQLVGLWYIPTILFGSWLQHFIEKCRENSSSRLNFNFCFTTYGQIEKAFKTYFIFFFASSQLYSIVVIFLSFSSFFSDNSLLSQDYYSVGSLFLIILRKVENKKEKFYLLIHLMQFSVQSLLLYWDD